MSAAEINSQEDDDFAYEDEHIELESENQEYDDLAESEFEARPAVSRAEAKSSVHPGTPAPPPPRLKTVGAEVATTPNPVPPPKAVGASSQAASPSAVASPPLPSSSKRSETKRPAKIAGVTKKRVATSRKTAELPKKAAARPLAKKVKKPAQKKSVAKRANTTAIKKAAPRKAVAAPKKAPKRAIKRSKATGAARTKRRKS